MKNRFLILSLLFVIVCAFTIPSVSKTSAGGGIKFENMSLAEAMQVAKETDRIIFIDVHTSWCGPCKQMAKTTFQAENVGKTFNKKFINLKIDAEKDPDGPNVSDTYSVMAYPTLLFIDGNGKLVKRVVGFQSEEKLLSVANKIK